ncbi:hypothetical protein SNE26_06690 [Mucilaginibacter sp. cycad4]|uniref:hypothetical protein n=1 Tax=Mucilaginibacter sp. cycad4 TaxID=3342096 RepID=UPI002AAAC5B8|nr:hypothetical protein [Mucilaginibacter gossypii]WPV01456.1 hypothetical protein SNE26_06690 [Mucilaginibacter gossypii]
MKTTNLIIPVALLLYLTTGCNPTDRNRKIGGSTDSSSVNRGGGPSISDTNTINRARKQGLQDSLNGDTTSKGNVPPSGQVPKK